jgi:Plasmid pRiA4b ORF-3-like protein
VQLRIGLRDITPTIWRRLLVPGSVRLAKLHLMFQAAMGWTDSHLHDFRIGDKAYGTQIDDYPDDELSESDVTVLAAVRGQRRFVYQYDFGDSWEHEVVVEEITTSPFGLKFAVCLDGQNACPPEDCGGYPGYALLLEALGDPTHEEHDSYRQWVGGSFDQLAFDVAAANAALQRVR